MIRRFAEVWGLAAVLIEHDMTMVRSVSDRLAVLDFGRTIAEGTPPRARRRFCSRIQL
jgi:ABC-type branched-subunit amino acid transport system ATPase component